MPPLLQVRDLAVDYAARGAIVHALRGVTFDLEAGESVGVLGESGSGKSTLASALLRVLPASATITRGSIRFRSRDLRTASEKDLQSVRGAAIALIPQEPALALSPVMRVGDQVINVLRAHRDIDRRSRRDVAERMLAEVGLDEAGRIFHSYPHELSGGQRQRVAIAQALVCRPKLVIADEPTSSLDTTTQAEILALLRRLRKDLGLTLLMIAHQPAVLAEITDRVLVMYAGRVVEDCSAASIDGAPLHPYTAALLKCMPIAPVNGVRRKVAPILGAAPDPAHLPPGCAFEPRCAEKLAVCTSREPGFTAPSPSRRVSCFKYGG